MNKQFIKNLDDYFKMMSESFDDPLPIKWVDNVNTLIGLFTVNNNVYQISCIEKANNIWKYDFYIVEKDKNIITLSPELTNKEKDKFRVLPTIKDGLDYLILKKSPKSIIIGATDRSRGRKKLYESTLRNIANNKEYEFYTKIYQITDDILDIKQIFVLYKSDIDKDVLSETILKSIEDEKDIN